MSKQVGDFKFCCILRKPQLILHTYYLLRYFHPFLQQAVTEILNRINKTFEDFEDVCIHIFQ